MVKKDYLLDTNVVSAIIKKNQIVQRKLDEVSFEETGVFISGITYYEVKRGLIASNGYISYLHKTYFWGQGVGCRV